MPKEPSQKLEKIVKLACNIRRDCLRMVTRGKSSHIGSSLSMVDLLAHLYGGWLNVKPQQPEWPQRDRFILSKGHATAALYAALAESGFFSMDLLNTYCCDGTSLAGHVTKHNNPGVEVSTGSLGHGLPIGLGMAHALKQDGSDSRVVVLLSDGECDEGSNWEAALMAPKLQLSNLLVIIDYNKIQSFGRVDEVLPLEPFVDKWKAFNWAVKEVDGHDHQAIHAVLEEVPFVDQQPSVILAHTVKGKGVSFMEDKLAWHYKSPTEEQLLQALDEIDQWEKSWNENSVR